MEIVIITALGVGGATVMGAVLGFVFRRVSERFGNVTLSFAAGVMLAASFIGLIEPSLRYGGKFGFIKTVIGIFFGALCINLVDVILPFFKKTIFGNMFSDGTGRLYKTFLFVFAIAIHNLPEGIAAGVAFGTDNPSDALVCAVGIALQNLPEGMVIISPMLSAGVSPGRTFFYAAMTGVVEVVGTLFGYFAVNVAASILPFALAAAGGSMIYVIIGEMIPETQIGRGGIYVRYAFLFGFSFMLVFSELL